MKGEETMNINRTRFGDALTIDVNGRLDTTTAPALETVLSEALEGVTDLTFNFEGLEYISSAGLRVLLAAQKRMNRQGAMRVKNVCGEIREVFDITGFSDFLTIE